MNHGVNSESIIILKFKNMCIVRTWVWDYAGIEHNVNPGWHYNYVTG